jgi:probable phosphoglycerate mutase
MPIILLIRHGETDHVKKGRLAGRQVGIHLNEAGQAEAVQLADKLKDIPIKAVYSSPLERTMETARPIATTLGLDIVPRAGLTETDIGEWTDKTVKQLRHLKLWKSIQNYPSVTRFPGGESIVEAQFRLTQEINGLFQLHEAKEIFACVSHADPIKLGIAYFLGLPLDFYQRLSISPASVTTLLMGEMGVRLMTLNYSPTFTFPKL